MPLDDDLAFMPAHALADKLRSGALSASALVDAYLEAGRDAGHPSTSDYNGAEQHGFARIQMTIRDGHRCSASVGYLRPALGRTGSRVVQKDAAPRRREYLGDAPSHLPRSDDENLLEPHGPRSVTGTATAQPV